MGNVNEDFLADAASVEDEVKKVADNGKESVDEAGKGDGKKLPVNTQSRTKSATVQQGAQQSQSNSRSTTRKKVDREALPGNIEAANDVYSRTPTAVDELMPWIRDDIDPKKVEAKKRNANFRKGLHEVVESLRVLSDIGASFAGGNAYKRNQPDYKRYEEEKAKIDEARNRALDRLFQAQTADRDYKRNLMNLAYGNAYKSETEQATEGSQRSASSTVGATNQEGHADKSSHGDGGGKSGKEENTVVNIPFTMSVKEDGVHFHPGNSTAQFKSNAKRVDFMNELASVTKKEEGSYQGRKASARNAWSCIYDGLADSNMFNGVNFYDDKGKPTAEGKQIMSLMLGSGENTVNSTNGEDSANRFMWNGKDLTGLREDLLMKYTLKTKGGQEKANTYRRAGWMQVATDEAQIGNGGGGQQAAVGEEEGAFNKLGQKKQQ